MAFFLPKSHFFVKKQQKNFIFGDCYHIDRLVPKESGLAIRWNYGRS